VILQRRHFLLGGLALAAGCRPRRGATPLPHPALGVQSGDADGAGATIWCKATRPGRLVVDWGDRLEHRVNGPAVDSTSDLCGQVRLTGLPAGARVRYRCHFTDGAGRAGDAVEGSLVTAAADRRATSLVWSGDLCGQGWGRNPEWGGYPIFAAMRRLQPELFVCSGDLIYADDPLLAEVKLADGRVWRNQMSAAKRAVAETLADFRGNFAYNLADRAMQDFAAVTAISAQWDDHEVRNNWYPGGTTDGDPRYRRERSESQLAARALRALREYVPFGARSMARRIARGPLLDVFVTDARGGRSANGPGFEPAAGPTTRLLGDAQLAWLERELAASRARWKLIALSVPIGLVVRDGAHVEAIAQGAGGPPAGRELEIARLLRFLHQRRIQNVAFLTADVHYPAAHLYHPDGAARFGPFTPFHELVAGPLHAGGFGPNPLDPTFGPSVLWQRPPPADNPAPWDGFLSFGHIAVTDDRLAIGWHGGGGELLHRLDIAAT
jgi:alkaline phosphatase D